MLRLGLRVSRQRCGTAALSSRVERARPNVIKPKALKSRFPRFSSRDVDFSTVLEEYEHPNPERMEKRNQRRRFCEFSNETLAMMAAQGVHGAFKERLLREIMRVDNCNYVDAYGVMSLMNRQLESKLFLNKIPYQIGIAMTWVVGIVVVPIGVFHIDAAMWFNEAYVHSEVPSAEDLDTIFKVGTWTWQWMEPIIGTASFVLLALQLVGNQMQMIDHKPLHEKVLTYRADKIHRAFPQYEREIVRDYAKSDPWGRDSFRVRLGFPANSVIPIHRR